MTKSPFYRWLTVISLGGAFAAAVFDQPVHLFAWWLATTVVAIAWEVFSRQDDGREEFARKMFTLFKAERDRMEKIEKEAAAVEPVEPVEPPVDQ